MDREVVYQADEPARLIFFDIGRNRQGEFEVRDLCDSHISQNQGDVGHPICIYSLIPTTDELLSKLFLGRFFLDIWGQAFKIDNIYSADWIFIHNE
jgi:hypothetical protein